MNDRRLESLIRMAVEIEELERSATAASPVKLVHEGGSGLRRLRTGGSRMVLRFATFAAAAACVGLAIVMSRGTGTPTVAPRPVAVDKPSASGSTKPIPRPPLQLVTVPRITAEYARELIESLEGRDVMGTGVLAIYEDSAGVVRCARWQQHDFGGRRLDQLSPGELVRLSYGPHCDVVGPHRLIAVAVRGPIGNLPNSDERVQELAECIVGESPTKCEAQATTVAAGSTGCLPTGLQVMVETLAMGKP